MFIQTVALPDVSELRFLPGREVLPSGALDFGDSIEAAASPLAARLFAIPGVARVSLDRNGVTVTRSEGDWRQLKPAILGAITERFMSGAPTLCDEATPSRRASLQDDGAGPIREALRQVIDPELGYNIVDLGLVYEIAVEDGGLVTVVMTTTTPGCPATHYLKVGAREAAGAVEGVKFVDVRLTYEPRWTPNMMTREAKDHFGRRDRGGW